MGAQGAQPRKTAVFRPGQCCLCTTICMLALWNLAVWWQTISSPLDKAVLSLVNIAMCNTLHVAARFLGNSLETAAGVEGEAHWRELRQIPAASEKDAKLAQKLDQLQPVLAVFLQECMGQLTSFGPT